MLNRSVKVILSLLLLIASLFLLLWLAVTRPKFPIASSVLVKNPISADLLEQHVKKLSIDLSPRDYQHVHNLNASALYIKEQLEQIGFEVEEQKYSVNDDEYKNLIARLGPESSNKIIIGAHYDVAGAHPGADDNASGVAGLIELARILKSHELNKSIEQTIEFVAYTLEEPPIYATEKMGSFVHAEREREKGSEIELMISLEMIAYYSDLDKSQNFPIRALNYFYPSKGNFVAVIDQLNSPWAGKVKKGMAPNMNLPVYSMNAPKSIPGIDFSDHRSYWKFGYPAVMITDTSFYRNTAYHTDQDTYDRLDYEKTAELIHALSQYLLILSQD